MNGEIKRRASVSGDTLSRKRKRTESLTGRKSLLETHFTKRTSTNNNDQQQKGKKPPLLRRASTENIKRRAIRGETMDTIDNLLEPSSGRSSFNFDQGRRTSSLSSFDIRRSSKLASLTSSSSSESQASTMLQQGDSLNFRVLAMRRNFVFQNLPYAVSQLLASHLVLQHVDKGVAVITEGEEGDYFYVIESGAAKVIRNGSDGIVFIAPRIRGDSFGEMALMYNCPRNASVITTEDSTLWAVDRVTFRAVVTRFLMEKDLLIAKALKRKAPWLHRALSPEQLSSALRAFRVAEYTKGQVVASFNVDKGESKTGANTGKKKEQNEFINVKSKAGDNAAAMARALGIESSTEFNFTERRGSPNQRKAHECFALDSKKINGYLRVDDEDEDEDTQCFYIVEEGKIECRRNENAVPSLFYPHKNGKILNPQSLDHFGEAIILGGNDYVLNEDNTDWIPKKSISENKFIILFILRYNLKASMLANKYANY